MKVAIIGAGNMGGAIARGLYQGTHIEPQNITVSNPSRGKLDALLDECPLLHTTHNNRAAAQAADIVILAVKPWLIEQVIQEIEPREGQVVVSVAAGIKIAQLEEMVGHKKLPLFRIMPNTAIGLLESVTIVVAHNATPAMEQLMVDIFNEMGVAMLLNEKQLVAATSMTSCGVAYALKYIQAVTQAGVELGIYPRDGMRMVAQSMKGAAELILQGDTHPAVEIDKVCTPGGYTIKGINTLDAHGFSTALIEAVKASCE